MSLIVNGNNDFGISNKYKSLVSTKKPDILFSSNKAINTDLVSFNGLSETLTDPQNGTITTPTGVKYYFATTAGVPNLESPKVDPNKFPQSQRISYNEVLSYLPEVEKARDYIADIYKNPQEQLPYQWLCKSSIEAEKIRALKIKQYTDEHYKGKIKDVIILGMGGNIGTMKMAATAVAKKVEGNTITANNGVRFHFVDSLEPARLNDIKQIIQKNPKSTMINLVSQSGTTFETIALNTLLQSTHKKHNFIVEFINNVINKLLNRSQKLPPENIVPIIGNKDSAIGAMAKGLNYQLQDIFDIPDWSRAGGRWTGNTAEPSFVIAMGGGDPTKWFDGYQKTIEDFIEDFSTKPFDKNGVMQSALLDVAYSDKNFKDFYTFAYGDKLAALGHALTQNVNESTSTLTNTKGEASGTGLVGKFFTGPAGQHADMQILAEDPTLPLKLRILEVEKDKVQENKAVFTNYLSKLPVPTQLTNVLTKLGIAKLEKYDIAENIIKFKNLFNNSPIPEKLKERANGMEGKKASELMKTMAGATGYDAWNRGRPVEFVSIPEINESTMASLLAEQYLRTLVWGKVNNIDVTGERAFPDYKAGFKKATEEFTSSDLQKGAPSIFYKLTQENK